MASHWSASRSQFWSSVRYGAIEAAALECQVLAPACEQAERKRLCAEGGGKAKFFKAGFDSFDHRQGEIRQIAPVGTARSRLFFTAD